MIKTILAVALLTATAACGGDDDGGDFSCTFEACGGDPVGEWTIVEACIGEFSIDACPEAEVDYSGVTQSGTVVVLDDGTYSTSIQTMGQATALIPRTCFQGATCEQVSMGSDELDCTGVGEDCDCTIDATSTDSENGTWTSSGNTLTTTASGGTPETVEYCVDGDSFKIHPEAGANEPDITIVMARN